MLQTGPWLTGEGAAAAAASFQFPLGSQTQNTAPESAGGRPAFSREGPSGGELRDPPADAPFRLRFKLMHWHQG